MAKVIGIKNKQKYMYEVVTGKGIYYISSDKQIVLPKLFKFLLLKGARPLSFKKKIYNEGLINFNEEGEIKNDNMGL